MIGLVKLRISFRSLRIIPLFVVIQSISGCVDMTPAAMKVDVPTIQGPAPRVNSTPLSDTLACLTNHRSKKDIRLGVADFVDGTGAVEGETTNSRVITQRPDMMMVVALSKTGLTLVNRNSTSVAEWELRNAIERKLGEGRSVLADRKSVTFRPVQMGSLVGSTHYVTGAVTELNWNISSSVGEVGAYSVSAGRRTYRISVAIDVMVTNTVTTEIVHARSYKKQLVGNEISAGLFRFVTSNPVLQAAALSTAGSLELFTANLGQKQNEPVQTALRWIIELAAYDVARSLTNEGDQCDRLLPEGSLTVEAARPTVVSQAQASPEKTATARGVEKKTVQTAPTLAPARFQSPQQLAKPADPSRQQSARTVQSSVAQSFSIELGVAGSQYQAQRLQQDIVRKFGEALGNRKLTISPTGRPGASYAVRLAKLRRETAGILCFRVRVEGGNCTIIPEANTASLTQRPRGG